MKIILYIGHHKVGSTTLQTYLSQNSYRLLQHGILYPFVEKQGAMLARAKQLMRSDKLGSGPINVREAHNALAFRMLSERETAKPFPTYHRNIPTTETILRTIQKQIKQHNPQAMILCSEVFSNLGPLVPDQISRLRDAFPSATFDIYLALRRPDEYIVSWQSQRLRFGEKLRALSNPKNKFGHQSIHFDYRALLEPWLSRIPQANLILRPYRDVLKNGGSCVDFVQMSTTDFPANMVPVTRQNPSLPNALMEIARLANRRLSKHTAHAVFDSLQAASAHIALPENNEVEMFGTDNRQRILELFEPTHAYLNTISHRSSFFADYSEIIQCKPIPEPNARRDALGQLTTDILTRFANKETAKFILHMRQNLLVRAT